MKGYTVYNAIHQLKDRGFKKDSVAKQPNINWRTVDIGLPIKISFTKTKNILFLAIKEPI